MVNIYKVKKRDGSEEFFIIDKLITSICKAGVPIKNAEKISQKIYKDLNNISVNNVIDSIKIRDIVINHLSENYPAEADNYKTYKK